MPSWLAQLDNPGTALTVGGWIRPGGGGAKLEGFGGGNFDTTPSVSSSVY